MALEENTRLRRAVEQVLPPLMIEELALEVGALKRRRKLRIALFVQTLVLGFGVASGRSLSGFRRLYQRMTHERIARSSFYQRFSGDLVALMKRLLDRAVQQSRKTSHLAGALDSFLEVLAIDSSIVRVSPKLAKEWPGAWPNHSPATVKITAVTNVVGRDLRRLRLVPGSRHDMHMLEPGRWAKNRLLVFDLGFFGARLFKEVDDAGGFFLSRLKKNAHPTVSGTFDASDEKLVGHRLNEAQKRRSKGLIDVVASMRYSHRPVNHRKLHAEFRVIAIWSDKNQTWHRYVTNAPPEMLPAKLCSAIYAARWEVELLFEELKSQYRLEEFRSNNGDVNLCFILAALLSLLVSRKLHAAVAGGLRRRRIPHDRWSRLFSSVATDLLRLCANRDDDGTLARELLFFLKSEAPDPNRKRCLLAERSSLGITAFA